MRLIHQDGRTQTVPDAAYARHLDTYTRAGWRKDANQTGGDEPDDDDGTILIRSRHNAEKRVTEEEFAETFEAAGWVKVDPKADAEAKIAARTGRKATRP